MKPFRSNPREYGEILAEQVLKDFTHLTPEQQKIITAEFKSDHVLLADKLKEAIERSPKQLPNFYHDILEYLPFKETFACFKLLIFTHDSDKWIEKICTTLGGSRQCLFIETAIFLCGNPTKSTRDTPVENLKVLDNLPDAIAVSKLTEELKAQLISIDEFQKHHLPAKLELLEKQYKRLDKDYHQAKENWSKNQERENKAHNRGKEKAAEEAKRELSKQYDKQIEALNLELSQSKSRNKNLNEDLEAALQRLKAIETGGGATPERLHDLQAQYQNEYEEKLRQELSAEMRPWLAKLKAMEEEQVAFSKFDKLSLQALQMARQQAQENDLILHWESHREEALPIMEERLEELDDLMGTLLSPSEELKKIHKELRELVLRCRQKVRYDEPLGGVVKAMWAGIRDAKDDDITSISEAVKTLRQTGVLDEREANALLKSITHEVTHRKDHHLRHDSPSALLERQYVKNLSGDIFIDGYNFMHAVPKIFQKFKTGIKDKNGNETFSLEAHQELARLVKKIPENNTHFRVLIFLDGKYEEGKKPFNGVRFITPTQQKSGKGQADAEILYHVKDLQRPGASVFIVSGDKAVQQLSNHLTPHEFHQFLSGL